MCGASLMTEAQITGYQTGEGEVHRLVRHARCFMDYQRMIPLTLKLSCELENQGCTDYRYLFAESCQSEVGCVCVCVYVCVCE